MKKNKYANLRTRVPLAVAEALDALTTEHYPRYRVVRDIVTAYVRDKNCNALKIKTIETLTTVAKQTNYKSVDDLLVDISQAFLHAYSAHAMQRESNLQPTDITEMFESLCNYEREKN